MDREPGKDLRNRNLRNIALITIAVILGLILLQYSFGGKRDENELEYSQFRAYVTEGKIAKVVIKDARATATTTDDVTYVVQLPEDRTLYEPLLLQYDVAVKYEPSSEGSWFPSILVRNSFGPTLPR